jgi:lipoprotein LpqB-like beta-propeller protein/sporulation and spore germination protein
MTHAGSIRARRPWRAPLAVALVAVIGALAACDGIPTAGPIGTGDGAVSEPGPVVLLAYGPPTDANPEEIVRGFLQAEAAGNTDNFAVAREYLTGSAQSSWDPHQQVVVYSSKGTPQISTPTESEVSLTYPWEATVDANGQYSEAAPGAKWEGTFDLQKDSHGQWRISGLPDGVLVSEPNFVSVYRSTPIYFLSKDHTFLVPEIRWFPVRNAVTAAVNALLTGPSQLLRDAVDTAFPDGVTQTVNGVTVDNDGTALVDVSGPVLTADADQRRLMRTQLDQTLMRLPGVRSIQLSVAGVPMQSIAEADLTVDPPPGTLPIAIQGDQLVTLSGAQAEPVKGVGSLAGLDARSLAQSDDGKLITLLSGSNRLVLAPTPEKNAVTLLTGIRLLAPSVDRFGWIWTGSATVGSPVLAVLADGTPATVSADWLEDRTVESIRVSHDGARIAVVSTGQNGVAVDLAAIVRDGSGRPVRLDTPLRVGAALVSASSVVWVDEQTLAVLGRVTGSTASTVGIVPIGGPTRMLPVLDGVSSLSAGKGERSIYARTADGSVFSLQGLSWRKVVDGISVPVYPG